MIPATVQRCRWETECRQWDTDKLRRVETGTSQYDLRKITSLLCKDQKVTREKQLGGLEEGHEETAEVRAWSLQTESMESSNGEHGVFKRRAWSLQTESMESSNGEHGGDTAWEQASPAAPTSTTSSSRAGPRRPTTTQRMGSSGSRQTDREWVVGQVDWYDKKPSLPRVYYVLTYRWQNTFSSCNRITKLNFYTILRQIYSLKSKDKLFWYVVRTCDVSERKLNRNPL